jgi:hypothetical protein
MTVRERAAGRGHKDGIRDRLTAKLSRVICRDN